LSCIKLLSSKISIILGVFAKFLKATIIFVMFVRLSVCPHRTTRLPLYGLSLKLIFRKSGEKIQV
jgi:hypothetical protein